MTARGEALASEYNAKHYHQPSDEWHADWDWSGVAQNAALLHDVGLRLANSRDWPNWSSDSEFRAARDASAAERRRHRFSGETGERMLSRRFSDVRSQDLETATGDVTVFEAR